MSNVPTTLAPTTMFDGQPLYRMAEDERRELVLNLTRLARMVELGQLSLSNRAMFAEFDPGPHSHLVCVINRLILA